MLYVAGERLAEDNCIIGRLLRLNRLVQAGAGRVAVVPCVCNPQAQAGRTMIGTWGGWCEAHRQQCVRAPCWLGAKGAGLPVLGPWGREGGFLFSTTWLLLPGRLNPAPTEYL